LPEILTNGSSATETRSRSPRAPGALPTLREATDPQVRGGQFFGPSGFLEARGYPKLRQSSARAGVTHDVKEYPAASHAFSTTEAGPRVLRPLLWVASIGPEADSAKDAWGRIESFFATHLH
jgi:hypothetical protein